VLPQADGERLSAREQELQRLARAVYEERIAAGVAREQARKDLPLSTYTEAYWKIDLHNLFHFLALRMDSHAQHEIRRYADTIGREIVSHWCPLAWEAFVDYNLNSVTLSAKEVEVARALVRSPEEALKAAIGVGLLPPDGTPPARSRELDDLDAKLAKLGLATPWRKKI
jgi:thymidylate synthase (FAD)